MKQKIKRSLLILFVIVMPWNWRRSIFWVLKVNFIFLAINLLSLLFLSLFFKVGVFTLAKDGFFSMVLLFESGIIFLVGGLVAMSSSIFSSKIREYVFHSGEKWSKEKHERSEARAILYILTGIVLFLESLASVFLGL
ncbi:MAG: hypothetical protein GWN16_13960 [Calditrichae bacterium]|nr:hypothetical protein [Calditrichia bacterium]